MKRKPLILLFALLLTILTACTTRPSPTPEVYPETVIIREPTEDNPLQFDWDAAMENIYIAGKKTGFPLNSHGKSLY